MIHFSISKIVSVQHVINITMIEVFDIGFLFTKSSESGVFYLYSTHPFRPATFQVLSGCMWLMATALDHNSR